MAKFGPSEQALGAAGREFGPHSRPANPQEAGKAINKVDEKTVTMVFPREVTLTTESYRRIKWPAGVHQVPQSLSDHPYLAAHGVKKHQVNAAQLPEPPAGDDNPGDDEGGEPTAPTFESLQALTKAQLIELAKKDHDLDLDPVSKKDDLILAIMEKVEDKNDASGDGQE